MAEPAKTTPPSPSQENPPVIPYPGPFNGSAYPPPGPPGAYPPFFPYPPPPDGAHTEGAQTGGPPAPYLMYGPPPGVMYAYPHVQPQGFGVPPAASSAPNRPKRKQVKMACTNCAGACKRCDETRPCERCLKYGIGASCVDGQRKERKKGIKRGPYKRKNKDADAANYPGEWSPGSQPPSASTAAAAIHAVPQYPPPEGYYPVYYPPPPPGTFVPPHDGQSAPDGSPPHPNGQPPMIPYYIHPGGYPPFPHYPPIYPSPSSGTPLQPPAQGSEAEQPQTINPADTASKPDDPPPPTVEENGTELVSAAPVKRKRSKTTKNGERKAKKVKIVAALENGKDEAIPKPPAEQSKPAPTNDGSDPGSPATTV